MSWELMSYGELMSGGTNVLDSHRGVPEGPKGSQRDPEEELRSVFKGKVARNNGLKKGFFQFLT